MKTVRNIIFSTVSLVAFLSPSAIADTVKIPVGSQGTQTIERPMPGMDKTDVSLKYGDPAKVNPAVGEPPIASWEYEAFIVYFEYNQVLHSVLKKQ